MFYYSFTIKLPVEQQESGFSPLKLVKQCKLALKKSHNSPILSHNLPENVAQFLIFNRTLSDGLYRPSDIMRWCDFAQLTSNHIRLHNLRKIA